MIMRCHYCDFHYTLPMPRSILEVLGDPELPAEDWDLWMSRLVQTMGFKEYHGMKIHVGRKHPELPCLYETSYTNTERELVERAGTNLARLTYQ